ncbi:MAG: hypothetical protein R2688_02615 [Fimbriimonadaceae bacterium]
MSVEITYDGVPHVARNVRPGMVETMWAKTPERGGLGFGGVGGEPVLTPFPCKDHPRLPNKATMRITVPEGLLAVGPGKLVKTTSSAERTKTF